MLNNLIFSEYSGKLKEPITTEYATNIKATFFSFVKKRRLKFALLLFVANVVIGVRRAIRFFGVWFRLYTFFYWEIYVMSDKKFIDEVLKPIFREYNNNCDSSYLLNLISEKEEKFTSTLNEKQKAQYEELSELIDNYYAVAKSEPVPIEYIESLVKKVKESQT